MKTYFRVIRGITVLGQLGFSLVVPPVAMALLARYLQQRFGLGTWLMLVCLAVGLMTTFATARQFYRKVMAAMERESEEHTKSGDIL